MNILDLQQVKRLAEHRETAIETFKKICESKAITFKVSTKAHEDRHPNEGDIASFLRVDQAVIQSRLRQTLADLALEQIRAAEEYLGSYDVKLTPFTPPSDSAEGK